MGPFSPCQAWRDSFLWNISVGEKKFYQLVKNLKETIFAEFRTEDVVLQYFLIAIIHYLQFVKFEVETGSQSNVDWDECAVVLRQICLYMW